MSAPLVVCAWEPNKAHAENEWCLRPRRVPSAKQCQCGDIATMKASKMRQSGTDTCEFCWRHEWAEQPSTEYPEIEC